MLISSLVFPDIVRRNRHRAGYHQGIAVLDLGGVRGHALEAVAAVGRNRGD